MTISKTIFGYMGAAERRKKMEDEIKTLSEYRMLVKEFKESDSVSKRESIKDAVYNKARVVLHELRALYAKYDRDYVANSDFQDLDRLFLGEFNESKVWLRPFNYWGWNDIEVQMKYLDDGEMEALEKELCEKRTMRVKRLIQEKKDAIERLKKEIEELEAKQ